MRIPLILLVAFLFAGCLDEKAVIQKFAPREDDELARRFLELIRKERYEEADPLLEPAVATQAGVNGLSQLHQIVDRGELKTVELIGANTGFLKPSDSSASKRIANLTYELEFPDAWVVAAFVIESSGSQPRITGVNFQPVPNSLRVLNRFTFKKRPFLFYLIFSAVVLIPVFIIFTIVICIRSHVRRRWLWIIFILVAFGRFNLNWSTGAWNIQPLSIMLLGSAWFRTSSSAPVMVSFGFPLGAIVFLMFRGRLRRKNEVQPELPAA